MIVFLLLNNRVEIPLLYTMIKKNSTKTLQAYVKKIKIYMKTLLYKIEMQYPECFSSSIYLVILP